MSINKSTWTVLKTVLAGISVLSVVAILLTAWMAWSASPAESDRTDVQGLTASMEAASDGWVEVQNVCPEELDEPERLTAALFQGRWEKLARTAERIPPRRGEPEIHQVPESRHGPLIHGIQPEPRDALSPWKTLNLNFVNANVDGRSAGLSHPCSPANTRTSEGKRRTGNDVEAAG